MDFLLILIPFLGVVLCGLGIYFGLRKRKPLELSKGKVVAVDSKGLSIYSTLPILNYSNFDTDLKDAIEELNEYYPSGQLKIEDVNADYNKSREQ